MLVFKKTNVANKNWSVHKHLFEASCKKDPLDKDDAVEYSAFKEIGKDMEANNGQKLKVENMEATNSQNARNVL